MFRRENWRAGKKASGGDELSIELTKGGSTTSPRIMSGKSFNRLNIYLFFQFNITEYEVYRHHHCQAWLVAATSTAG